MWYVLYSTYDLGTCSAVRRGTAGLGSIITIFHAMRLLTKYSNRLYPTKLGHSHSSCPSDDDGLSMACGGRRRRLSALHHGAG